MSPALHDGMAAESEPNPEKQLQPEAEPAYNKPPAPAAQSAATRSSPFMTSIVSKNHVDLILLLCAFCSGIVDSSMFIAYITFVSMQTGNTIFIALAISNQGPRPDAWLRPFLAVVCFIIGAMFFSRLFLALGSPRRRLTLVLNFAIQTLFVGLSAVITQTGAISSDVPETLALGEYFLALAPIALLAFQSAGQITASRALEVGELPTVVITSLLCDLFSDQHLFAAPAANVKRNRRFAGFWLTFAGAVIGGWMGKQLGTIVPALWLTAGLKVVLTMAWAFWPEDRLVVKNAV